MFLYITRHGETEWNIQGKTQGSQDSILTAKGKEQAHQLGERLLSANIRRIFCSDLQRAYQTAEIIGNTVHVTPKISPLLREICFGQWEGLTFTEIEKNYPGQLDKLYLNTSFTPEFGECVAAVQKRLIEFLKALYTLPTEEDEGVLVVSHAMTSKVLLLELLEIPITYVGRISISNTSISIVQVNGKKNKLLCLNDTCHCN